jgi:hypothetical protein
MLTVTFNRCRLRRTACVTLLAWVLALMAGVVNACLLQPHGQTVSASSIATSSPEFADARLIESTVAHVEHSHHDSHQAQQGDHDAAKEDADKAGCLKFCADESSTLAKGKFTQADLPNPAVVAVVEWPSLAPLPMGTLRRSAERPASPGPPLVIRFLRLTI